MVCVLALTKAIAHPLSLGASTTHHPRSRDTISLPLVGRGLEARTAATLTGHPTLSDTTPTPARSGHPRPTPFDQPGRWWGRRGYIPANTSDQHKDLAYMTSTKPSRRGYPPMPRDTWERITTWLDQAEASLSGARKQRPDIQLLAITPSGPLRSMTIGPNPEFPSSPHVVLFEIQNIDRGPRHCPPEVFAVIALLLLFGGGLNVNDSVGHDQGYAYLRLWGGNDRTMLSRVITDAYAGEVAKQHSSEGERADHHNYDPAFFSKTTVETVREGEGKPLRTPRRGRWEAVATALRYYRANHRASEVAITEAEYLATLRRAFRVLDAIRLAGP